MDLIKVSRAAERNLHHLSPVKYAEVIWHKSRCQHMHVEGDYHCKKHSQSSANTFMIIPVAEVLSVGSHRRSLEAYATTCKHVRQGRCAKRRRHFTGLSSVPYDYCLSACATCLLFATHFTLHDWFPTIYFLTADFVFYSSDHWAICMHLTWSIVHYGECGPYQQVKTK